MINPGAHCLCLELGKPRSQLPHTINCLGIFIDAGDHDLWIQSCAAQRPEPRI